MGLTPDRARSSVRFSLGRGNTLDQVDALIEAVAEARRAVAEIVAVLEGHGVDHAVNKESIIAVAMSGGVDSSAVAGMLQRDGQSVGFTMQLWNQRRLPELIALRAASPAAAAPSKTCTTRGTRRSCWGSPITW